MSKGANLVKARAAKKAKRMHYKVGAAKRTPTAQALKKAGITTEVGYSGPLILQKDIEITRGIGHPKRISKRGKKGRFRRKFKKIEVISRRTQPKFKLKVKLPRLDKKVAASGKVASSWISYLEWNPNNNTVTMGLLDGWNYVYKMSFELFQGWYYAHSKGTYWHEKLRGRYFSRYINKYFLP